MKSLTPRQLREEIETIDSRLRELKSRERKLASARKRYLLQGEPEVVRLIEGGLVPGSGRPDDDDLALLDQRGPGLEATRDTLAELRERRALLEQQRPSPAQVRRAANEVTARAKNIRGRAKRLTTHAKATVDALNAAAELALTLAEETHCLFKDNAELDQLAIEADIERPPTPRCDAPKLPIAPLLSVLLNGRFNGGQPGWVDENLARQLRRAIEHRNQAGAHIEAG